MNRNLKYKTVCRLQVFGDDNTNVGTNFSYAVNPGPPYNSNVINGVRMRFKLNGALNDVKLSTNARCIVEMCNIPTLTNATNKYAILRLVTSTQDKVCDTKKFL